MSASPKAQHFDGSRLPTLRPGAAALEIVAKPARLDFAANPNHYTHRKIGKPKPIRRPREADLSPRLVLGLSLECETSQLLDPDYGD